ncbi:MAG TPA: SDR family oxidoreductase [Acidimicrobiales bacterium]|nr:SDR family oxidoreductase [Acidimicrobiales bacterium]
MKAAVVGGSSGLGRCIGVGLARRHHHVALLARRYHRLVEAAKEAGPGSLAIACDVTDADSCRSALSDAAAGLGGLDALVYCAGVGILARLADTDASVWRQTLDTNLTGAALVTSAALPHLRHSRGAAAYLSSWSASLTAPWPGLGAYVVSKAALDKLVEAWRVEQPEVGFTRIVVGNSAGGTGDGATEMVAQWDPGLLSELWPGWEAKGYFDGGLVDTDDLVETVQSVLQSGPSSPPSVTVMPRPAHKSQHETEETQ